MKKIHASTLVEVIVALVILMSIFFIAMNFIEKANVGNVASVKLKALIMLDNYIDDQTPSSLKLNDEYVKENFTIVKDVSAYSGHSEMILIQYKVYNHKNNLILERKEIWPNSGI